MNRILHYLNHESGQTSPGVAPTDQQLLEQYLQYRNQDAFANLVRRHEQAVLKACRQVLRSPVDADDAFQATFLVLLRRARQIHWQPCLRGWLVAVAHRIAVRLAITQHRSATALKSPDVSSRNTPPSPTAEVSWHEACAILHEELNRLRDPYRLPLLLCYLQGLSRDEAAQQLGWTLGSVKAGLERGRAQLKARLERRGVTLSAGLLTLLLTTRATDAGILSPVAATLALLTGNIPARVLCLSRYAGFAGSLFASRLALSALILLIGTAAGLTLTWAKNPSEQPVTLAASSVPSPVTSVPPDQPDAITVTGTVLDPAGQPAAGASIMVVKPPKSTMWRTPWPKPEPGTTTNAQGHFQLTVSYPQFHLVAQKPGFGLDFFRVTAENARQPVKLQLGEEMPIQGVVMDEAQKPVEGATLGMVSIRRYQPEALEDALEQVRQTGDENALFRNENDYLLIDFPSLLSTQSDAQGRFDLRGLPVGSMSQFMYAKPGLVSKAMFVVLLKGFAKEGTARHRLSAESVENAFLKRQAQPASETIEQTRERYLKRGYVRSFEGSVLNITMKKGVSLEGTVRNLKGEPVAGVRVYAHSSIRGSAITDQQGRYRLEDVGPAEDYTVEAQSNDRYLGSQTSAVHRDAGPIRIDMQVRPGAILRGQVIDGKTGKGVRSYIQVKPTPGNPLLIKPNVLFESSTTTEADGSFRLVAPPGDVIVTANPSVDPKPIAPMPYIPARILPSHQGLLQSNANGEGIQFRATGQFYQLGYAYQLLELSTEGETTVELTMSHGQERTVLLVDPQGKPLESALIAGLDQTLQPQTVKGGTHQVVGLTSTERRFLFVINRERKLGAMILVLSTSTEPLTLRLEPLASLSARLVDTDNKPRASFSLAARPAPAIERLQSGTRARQEWNASMLNAFFPPVRTDADGLFTMENLLPNIDLQCYPIQIGTSSWISRLFTDKYLLKPGEQRTLGDMKVQDINRQRPTFRQ